MARALRNVTSLELSVRITACGKYRVTYSVELVPLGSASGPLRSSGCGLLPAP